MTTLKGQVRDLYTYVIHGKKKKLSGVLARSIELTAFVVGYAAAGAKKGQQEKALNALIREFRKEAELWYSKFMEHRGKGGE